MRGAGITATLAPPPWHPPWLNQTSFITVLPCLLYLMIFAGFLAVVAFCQILNLLRPISDFILNLEIYNHIGYRNLLYPLHVSIVTRQKNSFLLHRRLCLCVLDRNVFTDVVNLDKYNMFLLGITFQGMAMLLQDFLLLHQLSLLVTYHLLDRFQIQHLCHPQGTLWQLLTLVKIWTIIYTTFALSCVLHSRVTSSVTTLHGTTGEATCHIRNYRS